MPITWDLLLLAKSNNCRKLYPSLTLTFHSYLENLASIPLSCFLRGFKYLSPRHRGGCAFFAGEVCCISYQVRLNTYHYPKNPTPVKLRFTSPPRKRGGDKGEPALQEGFPPQATGVWGVVNVEIITN